MALENATTAVQHEAVVRAAALAAMRGGKVCCAVVRLAVSLADKSPGEAGRLLPAHCEVPALPVVVAGQVTRCIVLKHEHRVGQTVEDRLLTYAHRSIRRCGRRHARIWCADECGCQHTQAALRLPSTLGVPGVARLRARLAVPNVSSAGAVSHGAHCRGDDSFAVVCRTAKRGRKDLRRTRMHRRFLVVAEVARASARRPDIEAADTDACPDIDRRARDVLRSSLHRQRRTRVRFADRRSCQDTVRACRRRCAGRERVACVARVCARRPVSERQNRRGRRYDIRRRACGRATALKGDGNNLGQPVITRDDT